MTEPQINPQTRLSKYIKAESNKDEFSLDNAVIEDIILNPDFEDLVEQEFEELWDKSSLEISNESLDSIYKIISSKNQKLAKEKKKIPTFNSIYQNRKIISFCTGVAACLFWGIFLINKTFDSKKEVIQIAENKTEDQQDSRIISSLEPKAEQTTQTAQSEPIKQNLQVSKVTQNLQNAQTAFIAQAQQAVKTQQAQQASKTQQTKSPQQIINTDPIEYSIKSSSSTYKAAIKNSNFYQTQIGEEQRLTLADNSILHLYEDSTAEYSDEEEYRLIKLLGSAYFEIADDDQRNFVVHSCEHRIKANNAKFKILLNENEDKLEIQVHEGVVNIISPQEKEYEIKSGEKLNLSTK